MATGVLARADAAVLLLCGAGEEAWWHARALSLVRPLQRVLVWARSAERAARFAARVTQELQLPCEVATTLRGAVAQADIICTATSAAEPYLMGEWLRPGTHLTLVGSAVAHTSEVDAATVAAARFFVDYRAAALQQAGELIAAVQAGVVSFEHIAGEIGEVLLGRVPGRRSRDEITIYKSLGVCTQDLAAACEVHAVARARGVGISFDLQS
jgi:ornithine cyclodeaminase